MYVSPVDARCSACEYLGRPSRQTAEWRRWPTASPRLAAVQWVHGKKGSFFEEVVGKRGKL